MLSSGLNEKIEEQRRRLGTALSIVGHHYQSDVVLGHADLRGDSLELARKIADIDSENIVFCGVYFMGESAALLAGEGQKIHLPVHAAECSMALMSPAAQVEAVMGDLTRSGRRVIPLSYVNSTLAVKAVVGKYGGAVCTSANAAKMLEWALSEGEAVLFLPDRNLGLNTANLLGVPESERCVLDLALDMEALGAGGKVDETAGSRVVSPIIPGAAERAETARLVLWPGYCSIHTHFTLEQMAAVRAAHPGVKIIVHPECTPEVTSAADAAGSTSFIIKYAAEAPEGSTLAIATEINLVRRLAARHSPKSTILPLAESECSYMGMVTEKSLSDVLDAVESGDDRYVVRVDEALKGPARAALERMLAVCA